MSESISFEKALELARDGLLTPKLVKKCLIISNDEKLINFLLNFIKSNPLEIYFESLISKLENLENSTDLVSNILETIHIMISVNKLPIKKEFIDRLLEYIRRIQEIDLLPIPFLVNVSKILALFVEDKDSIVLNKLKKVNSKAIRIEIIRSYNRLRLSNNIIQFLNDVEEVKHEALRCLFELKAQENINEIEREYIRGTYETKRFILNNIGETGWLSENLILKRALLDNEQKITAAYVLGKRKSEFALQLLLNRLQDLLKKYNNQKGESKRINFEGNFFNELVKSLSLFNDKRIIKSLEGVLETPISPSFPYAIRGLRQFNDGFSEKLPDRLKQIALSYSFGQTLRELTNSMVEVIGELLGTIKTKTSVKIISDIINHFEDNATLQISLLHILESLPTGLAIYAMNFIVNEKLKPSAIKYLEKVKSMKRRESSNLTRFIS